MTNSKLHISTDYTKLFENPAKKIFCGSIFVVFEKSHKLYVLEERDGGELSLVCLGG